MGFQYAADVITTSATGRSMKDVTAVMQNIIGQQEKARNPVLRFFDKVNNKLIQFFQK